MKNNVYGNKAAGRVWNQHLVKKLKAARFKQSDNDECLFFYTTTVYVLYTNDSILTGPSTRDMDHTMNRLKTIGLDITEEGEVGDFLEVHIDREDVGRVILSQSHLIDSILKDLRLDGENVTTKVTPATPNHLPNTILPRTISNNPLTCIRLWVR